jgi:hypothetical protein
MDSIWPEWVHFPGFSGGGSISSFFLSCEFVVRFRENIYQMY